MAQVRVLITYLAHGLICPKSGTDQHLGIRAKGWLVWSLDNVSNGTDMFTRGLVLENWIYNNATIVVGLVQRRHDIAIKLFTLNWR